MSMLEAHMSDAQLACAREALLGPSGDELVEWMVARALHRAEPSIPPATLQAVRDAGWIDANRKTTTIGMLAGDSLREYRFWIERGHTTHGARHHPLTANTAYAGKDVLEVGCGFGANLLSLQGFARSLRGVDPFPTYRQMAPILAAREGREVLEIVGGLGESLPFAAASFDILLCYSSHQYMDVKRAFVDMARVLRPGGQLQLVSGELDQFMSAMREQRAAGGGLRTMRHTAEVWLNTRAYQSFGRRVIGAGVLGTTAVPIYPEVAYVERWLSDAGLVYRPDLTLRVNTDSYVFADKPTA
jgi:SAM-dependent methyltransferase